VKERGIISHFRLVLGGDVFGKGLTALSILLTIRTLPAAELADYIYFSAIGISAFTFFNGFFNRQYIFDADSHQHIAGYRIVSCVLTVIACFGLVAFSKVPNLLMVVPTTLFAACAINYEIKRSVLQKEHRFHRFSIAEPIRTALFLVMTGAILLFTHEDRALLLLAAQALAYFLVSLALEVEGRDSPYRWREQVRLVLNRISNISSVILMAYFILVGLFGQLPVLLYKPQASVFDYAQFGSAFRYYGLLIAISAAVNVVSLPKIAHIEELAPRVILASMAKLFALSIGLVAVAVIMGFVAIPIVDRGAYPAAPLQFGILAIGVLLGVFLGPLGSLYLRAGRIVFLFLSQVVAIGVSAALILLAGSHGPWAVAAAMPVGVACQLVLLLAGLNMGRGRATVTA